MSQILTLEGDVVFVDDEDYKRILSLGDWHTVVARNGSKYAVRYQYRPSKGRSYTIGMHRDVMNADLGTVVDHRNRDGLDNRRKNLRVCSYSDNNRRKIVLSKSGFRGVFKRGKRFCVQFKYYNGKSYHGAYKTKEAAALAYDEIAKKVLGDLAVLNFPDGGQHVV